MSGDVVIRAEGLGKKYAIGHQAPRERYLALRDVIARGARGAVRKAADLARGRALIGGEAVEEFWALKDVSFEVRRGEVLGIIGRNGAGKSTLLKILSRITEPSAGRVEIDGRVASLLEVGTGFHPELTGRENIYLNGAILGMTRAEIKKKFDEIVAFAEVEKFLDTPVKRYSSGMYVRLAFAVAAHLEPEILVVDEVLAVGDAEFQKKCLGKMDEVSRRDGRTVLFVSHNMGIITKLCRSGIVLEAGRVAAQGRASDGVRYYLATVAGRSSARYHAQNPSDGKEWYIRDAWLEQDGRETDTVKSDAPLSIMMIIQGFTEQDASLEITLRDYKNHPLIFCPSTLGFDQVLKLKPGNYSVTLDLSLPALAIGPYSLDLMLAEAGRRFFDEVESALQFNVNEPPNWGWIFRQDRGQGAITLPKGAFKLESAALGENYQADGIPVERRVESAQWPSG